MSDPFEGYAKPVASAGPDPFEGVAKVTATQPKPQGIQLTYKPGMTDDEIIRQAGFDPEVVKKASDYKPGAFSNFIKSGLANPEGAIPKWTGGPLAAIGKGLLDIGHGVSQVKRRLGKAVGLDSDADIALYEALKKVGDTVYNEVYAYNNPSRPKGQAMEPNSFEKGLIKTYEFVGRSTPGALVPGGGSLQGVKLLSGPGARALGQAALAGGAAALGEPVTEKPGMTTGEFVTEKAKQAGLGAIGSAAGKAVIEKGVVPAVAKLVNAVKGGAVAPAAERFLKDAELLGVREYTAGQAMGGGVAKQIEGYTQGVPLVGPRAKLKAGLTELAQKAASIDDRLQREMATLGYNNQDELVQAAAGGSRNATRLVNRIANAADDSNRIIQTSLDANSTAAKSEVGQLYNKVGQAMRGTGDVDLSDTRTLLSQLVDAESSSVAPNENVLREASSLLKRINDPSVNKDWNGIRKAVSDLGNKAKMLASGNQPDNAASSVLGDIREALRTDMNKHVNRVGQPDAMAALKAANEAYSAKVVPFKDRSIRAVIDSVEPDRQVKALINTPGFRDRASTVYSLLDDKGKAAFRYSIFHDALEKAGGSGEAFSPAKLATELEKRMGEIGVTFKGRDLAEMKAVANVMRHMEGTRLADFVPNNGAKLLPWVAGGTAATNPGALAPMIGFGLLGKFMTQGPGKRYVLAASSLPPGHPALDKIVKEIASKLPRAASVAAASEATEQE